MNISVLTPVKNEEWIIDLFIKQTSGWADRIIVADQQSTDNTVPIALQYNKVILVKNKSIEYNEGYRQRLLIKNARRYGTNQILFALDADEMLSPGFKKTTDWQTILTSPPGTAFYFRWINITPDLKHYWSPPLWFNFAYLDDGAVHKGSELHSQRLPTVLPNRQIRLEHIKVLHLQYINWARMASKQRWYQCHELVNDPHKSTIQLYRQYHHMDIPKNQLKDLTKNIATPEIIKELEKLIITANKNTISYYWDELTRKLIEKHGDKYFAKVIPRSLMQKLFHFYLRTSQKYYGSRIISIIDKLIDRK